MTYTTRLLVASILSAAMIAATDPVATAAAASDVVCAADQYLGGDGTSCCTSTMTTYNCVMSYEQTTHVEVGWGNGYGGNTSVNDVPAPGTDWPTSFAPGIDVPGGVTSAPLTSVSAISARPITTTR
jgi:hypothetical protein